LKTLLVANRSEIAVRVLRTAREMGIATVAVYSDADRNALHVRRADHAVHIGGSAPAESYLRTDKILDAAKATGADAIHPGYGFLAENADFARACADAGITFVGPPAEAIALMGDKVAARKAADQAQVPLVPGLKEDVRDLAQLQQKANEIGYPVMLKAALGGGGKGIRIVANESELEEADKLARAEAMSAFGDDRMYLEKLVAEPRHVEFQVMADSHGNVVHYGERECSVQRRHQKLVEESPSMALTEELRHEMGDAACRLAKAVDYVGAGTVEFLYSRGSYYFLEMNTRLQVEHPVTEMRHGADLVREQLRIAAGEKLAPVPAPRGHAIEVRINAEDPETFFPSLGKISRLATPGGPGVRLDAALFRGLEITADYDSMMAKLIVHAGDRELCIARARRALAELRLVGVQTSVPVALRVLDSQEFKSGRYDTGILDRIDQATPKELHEIAALAAAVAKYHGTERVTGGTPSADRANSNGGASNWVLIERMERLGGRAPRR
jgi:acetyl-CoA carboxylase biotin carboxylase subunit